MEVQRQPAAAAGRLHLRHPRHARTSLPRLRLSRVWVFGAGMADVAAQWNRVPGMSTPKKKKKQGKKRARASASSAPASGATAGGASAASTKKGRKGGKGKGR